MKERDLNKNTRLTAIKIGKATGLSNLGGIKLVFSNGITSPTFGCKAFKQEDLV